VSPASLQTFIDTPNCVLEGRVQYSTVHISNVFCDGHLQLINCVGTVLYCNHQVHRNVLITLYLRLFRPPLFSFFQPTALLILFFFQVVFGLPFFLYPDISSSVRVMLLRSVVYALYDQSEATLFLLFVVPIFVCSFLYRNSCKLFFGHLTSKHVVAADLQTLGVNYLLH